MKRWCDGFVEVKKVDNSVEKIYCRHQDMTLERTTVKNVENIEAFICLACKRAQWLPEASLTPFLKGLSENK